jgi:glycine hydroxymethyltransferase
MQSEFQRYARDVVGNAKELAAKLISREIALVTGGTDNHLMLIDLRPIGRKGRDVQAVLDSVGITLNANTFPGHGGSPFNPNGLRLGTPSVTSRGMTNTEMGEIAQLIAKVLQDLDSSSTQAEVRAGVTELCARFLLPYRSAA